MLFKNILIALRSLARNKVSGFINIFGLALGMATSVLIFLWVQNEWTYDSYHAKADQLYRIQSHIKISEQEYWHWGSSPLLLGEVSKEEIPEIEQFARIQDGRSRNIFTLNGEHFKEEHYAFVDKQWFQLFDYEFIAGNARTALENPQSLVLTASKARQYFGDADPMGKLIQMDTISLEVTGIIADNPANSSFQFDFLMPLELGQISRSWGNFNYITFLQLRKDAEANAVAQKITDVLRANKVRDSTSYITIVPVTSMHFDRSLKHDTFVSANSKTVSIFAIIAFLILLIACINYVSLTTAKASLRTKEVSVKKIIGAERSQLFAQFMTESVLTSVIAMVLAFGMALLGLSFFNRVMETSLSLQPDNWNLWLIFGGTMLVSILLTGIYPSLLMASFQPVKMLRGISWVGGKNSNFRKGLVVLQFFVATVLIISTLVIYSQLRYIQNKDLGYDKEHVFSVSFSSRMFPGETAQEQYASSLVTFQSRLEQQASIVGTAKASEAIVSVGSSSSGNLDWSGRDPDYEPPVGVFSADPAFKDLFGLELAAGRWFEEGNTADENNIILNEKAVNTIDFPEPVLGQTITAHGRTGQVIGIVKDFHYKSLHETIEPMVIQNNHNYGTFVFIKTTPANTAQAIAATQNIWQDMLPDQPFEYAFVDETYDNLYRTEQRSSQLLNVFAGIAIFISCLGLFGLAAFAAERRAKEVGIRKVLGASITNIVTLLSKEFVMLVSIAFVFAVPAGWWAMSRWLEDFAYRIELSWWIFAFAGMLALFIAVLTVSFQALRAALDNPINAIRTE